MATPRPAVSGRLEAPKLSRPQLNGVESWPAAAELVQPGDLLVGDLALGLGHGEIDLALVGAVDIGGGEERDIAGRADDRGIGGDDIAELGTGAFRHEAGQLLHRRLVLEIDTEGTGDRIAGDDRVVGGEELARIGGADVVLVDDFGRELDRHGDRGLYKGGVALGKDREHQKGEEGEPDGDGGDAVKAEAGFGGVAALEAEIALGSGGGLHTGRGHGGLGHSYCSRYLRTM